MDSSFHISLPCIGIERTKNFYHGILGASLGRVTNQWVDVNLYGHQLTFTKCGDYKFAYKNYKFEGTILPSFHFGVILAKEEWERLYTALSTANVLKIDKTSFLQGKNGEHSSFFVKDPNGYIVEFKTFKDETTVFES